MTNPYDAKYEQPGYYWGKKPSSNCCKVLELMPPDRPLRLLDIGCGEGRNAVFFARNGYQVTAFDLSRAGVDKTRRMAEEAGASLEVFQADLNAFRLTQEFDILFSTGTLHYISRDVRAELLAHYKRFTRENGLNAFTVFVKKPFVAKAPDGEAHDPWISGELLTHYHDWKIEFFTEEVFDCMSGGIPHQHAVNRMIARKPPG
jgi:tellurite methyltransferase